MRFGAAIFVAVGCWGLPALAEQGLANAPKAKDGGDKAAVISTRPAKDWAALWQRSGVTMPKPSTVRVAKLGDLGSDLEDRDWQMVSTRYHQLYFQPSANIQKIAELYQLMDGLYVFLGGRNPAKPPTPIQAFLVPGERGRSRCTRALPAMRTGEQADVPFLLTSLLHEETHLFNFAFLQGSAQNWWAGEFSCIYFQERAGLESAGKDVPKELKSRLSSGPIARIDELEKHDQEAFDEAISVMFFLEEKYGRDKLNEFRRRALESSKSTGGAPLPVSVLKEVFAKDVLALDKEWYAFFGWKSVQAGLLRAGNDPRLDKEVKYVSAQASVQDIVDDLATQVGLKYDRKKSFSQTDPECRRWVRRVSLQNKTCRQALEQILRPVRLAYRVEDGAIVLERR